MMHLLKRLKDAEDAHESAQNFVAILATSVQRFERILGGLDSEIERQKSYLNAKHLPTDTNLAFASLGNRRNNVARSLETLRQYTPTAGTALSKAQERLDDLRAFVARALQSESEPVAN